MSSDTTLEQKFDLGDDEDEITDPARPRPQPSGSQLPPPMGTLEGEVRLLRAAYQQQGKVLGELQATSQRLEQSLHQHGQDSQKAMAELHGRLDVLTGQIVETNKRLDLLIEALKSAALKP